jgi:DNA end-binding protein Ku
MKAVWRGNISFGLVSIAVELFSAIKKRSGVNFDLLHEKCRNPLHYKRWCNHCQQEVAWEETAKGLKLPDNSYFIVNSENLKKLKEEKRETLHLLATLTPSSLDPLYLNEHYYIIPEKKAEYAYSLLAASLKSLSLYLLGQFIMHENEHLCIIQPYKEGILLTTLHYAADIRPFPPKFTTSPTVNKQELQLAELLIKKLSSKKINLATFKDKFVEKLQKLLKEKTKKSPRKKEKKSLKKNKLATSSLLESLQASLTAPAQVRASKGAR